MQDCGHTPEWAGPIAERAMRHGINANQLRRWMRLQHWREASSVASAAAPVMLPVTIAEPTHAPTHEPSPTTPASPVAPAIEIELAGAVVRVAHGVDVRHLRAVLQALRA